LRIARSHTTSSRISGLTRAQEFHDPSEFPAQLLLQRRYFIDGSRARSRFETTGDRAGRMGVHRHPMLRSDQKPAGPIDMQNQDQIILDRRRI